MISVHKIFIDLPSAALYTFPFIGHHCPFVDNFQHRRNTVGRDEMSKSKDSRRVAPANGKEATKNVEDWTYVCKDCEILRLYSDCAFGCELIKASLRKIKKNKSGVELNPIPVD